MIHYHGAPVGCPSDAAGRFYAGRHAFVSFAETTQLAIVADVCQSFALDNGAFSAWRSGAEFDWSGYLEFCGKWLAHPACDWAVIPDVIDGSAEDNDQLIAAWPFGHRGVPVWHLHEPISRLVRLTMDWPRVALGSSGEWATPGVGGWWNRMAEALNACVDAHGRPRCKLHGMRMLDPRIFEHLPLASADSTNAARNASNNTKWAPYLPREPWRRAGVIADRIEAHSSAPAWSGDVQECFSF